MQSLLPRPQAGQLPSGFWQQTQVGTRGKIGSVDDVEGHRRISSRSAGPSRGQQHRLPCPGFAAWTGAGSTALTGGRAEIPRGFCLFCSAIRTVVCFSLSSACSGYC